MVAHSRSLLILLTLTVVGVAAHLLPHAMGVSPLGALGLLCAAYLPRHLLAVPVLVTLVVGDMAGAFYPLTAMVWVYLAHVFAALAVSPALTRVNPQRVIGAAVLSAVVFYGVSNVSQVALAFFPNTLEGWFACYVAGLPYLLKGVMANLVFGGMAFGIIHYVSQARAHRLAAS